MRWQRAWRGGESSWALLAVPDVERPRRRALRPVPMAGRRWLSSTLPRLPVSLLTIWATSLPCNCKVSSVFAQAEVLVVLTVFGGAYAGVFLPLLRGEAWIGYLDAGLGFGGTCAGSSADLCGLTWFGTPAAGVGRLGEDEGVFEGTAYCTCVRPAGSRIGVAAAGWNRLVPASLGCVAALAVGQRKRPLRRSASGSIVLGCSGSRLHWSTTLRLRTQFPTGASERRDYDVCGSGLEAGRDNRWSGECRRLVPVLGQRQVDFCSANSVFRVVSIRGRRQPPEIIPSGCRF